MVNRICKLTFVTITSFSLFSSLPAQAQTMEEKGLEIVQEVDRRDLGWNNSEADMTMELRNQHGDTSTRFIRSRSLEVDGDGDKGLTIFDKPRDVKGTAFLSFSHIAKPDDQWLFLPALKRVKRISSRNKSGPFMGSEFAYEDMSSFEVDKYTYKYLRDEQLDGMDCFVVESYPVDKYSGYTRLVSWFDKAEYRVQKIDYYDRKNALLKTLRFNDYQLYLDKYWRSLKMDMVNQQNGKSTTLTTFNLRFRTGLTDKDFNKNSLKRAK
ncbi:MAG: outer membrane lipoprotein-sorting protein [Motiliproteus sp.]|nr:outer membrane lipoprotein-sorting protein [Motiliproteus sp.]MCW9053031.1 outer membrane lipoprotein-sorting protein [Motiliproteus sp.]